MCILDFRKIDFLKVYKKVGMILCYDFCIFERKYKSKKSQEKYYLKESRNKSMDIY